MQALQVFSFKGADVRTVMVDGEPWWVARDVCEVLGLDTTKVARSVDDDEKGQHTVPTPGGNQDVTTVNEAGLYSLILKSRKASAREFKRWLTHEVLPSIRKTGSYSVAPVSELDRLAAMTNQIAGMLTGAVVKVEATANEALQLAQEAKAIAAAKDVDVAKVTQDAANVVLMDQARAAKLRPVLEGLCKEYGRLRNLNGYGDQAKETIGINQTLKRTYGKRDLLTVQQLERAIGFVQSLIADLPNPEQPMGL